MRSQEQGARSQPDDKGYRRVVAFQKADKLASLAYDLSKGIAANDKWLASQLMRAALSAPLNIVEGHGRGTVRDYVRFVETASASLDEVEYLLDFMCRKGIISEAVFHSVEPVRKEAAAIVVGLLRALRNKLKTTNNWQRSLGEERGLYLAGSDDFEE